MTTLLFDDGPEDTYCAEDDPHERVRVLWQLANWVSATRDGAAKPRALGLVERAIADTRMAALVTQLHELHDYIEALP